MAWTIWGVVKDGHVVPSSPLPEGALVEIRLPDPAFEIPENLRVEFEAWDQASASALEAVERLASNAETLGNENTPTSTVTGFGPQLP